MVDLFFQGEMKGIPNTFSDCHIFMGVIPKSPGIRTGQLQHEE
jgi:hypothetical protein